MKITLNLATHPYADQGPALRRLRIGMAVLVVVLLGLGLGLLHFHQAALQMAAQEAAVDDSIARIGQEQRGYQAEMQQPANAKVLQQAEFLNGLFDEKSFSWTAAMEDLERVLPGGVQVTAIEPARGKDGRLTLRLRISGLRPRSVEMVRNMEQSRRFADPRVVGENAETGNAQGDLQPVRDGGKVSFEIQAEYNPATLEERKAEIAAQKQRHTAPAPVALSPLPRSAPGGRLGAGAGPRPGYVVPNGATGLRPGQPAAAGQGGLRGTRPLPAKTPGGPQ